jgi:putative peptidoglycan lipid II flippase
LGAISFAHEDTRTPMFAALAGLAAATAGALMLFPTYSHVGVAAAIALSGWVGALLLGIILLRRRWLRIDDEARRRLPLLVLATLVMGLVILAAQKFLAAWNVAGSALTRVSILAILVVLGLATYGAMLHLTKAVPLRELITRIRRF